jgi:enamine deaminase RidA (YjgF/YER057c/UK114 family)
MKMLFRISFFLAALATASCAPLPVSEGKLEKNYYNYSEWTKGLFAEAVTVRTPGAGKMIFLGGIGAEEEAGKPGAIRAPGDIAGQCDYTFAKISRVLGRNGATLRDIVKMTSYLTSPDYIGPYIGCRNKHFQAAGATLPAETLVIVNRLAWPPMLLEVDVNAMTEK